MGLRERCGKEESWKGSGGPGVPAAGGAPAPTGCGRLAFPGLDLREQRGVLEPRAGVWPHRLG